MPVDLQVLHAQLERWAGDHYDEGVTIAGLEPMPGHAGLSFGFRVERHGAVIDDLVMRMPPKGVRRRGNTDVLRQVPLLQAMRRSGVPVADVIWWDADERWFEVPYFMVGRLPGATYTVREPKPDQLGLSLASIFEQAIDALAQVHRVDWTAELANWEAPKALVDEITFWDPILAKAAEPAWISAGEQARDALLAHLPADPVVGVFHGDYQTQNLLFHEGSLVAVLDWEISGIGAQLLDLGWLLMMNDPESWHEGEALRAVPEFGGLVEGYGAAVGRPVRLADVAFYRALSGYRFGVITGLNVMLHRTGKRPDDTWETTALSVPSLFGRAVDVLRGA